jgi:cytochrome b6-f complex iron-sulfur subunit
MSLRLIPPDPTTACPGCSRRDVLQGLAITAATVAIGCGGGEGTVPPPDASPPLATTMCGAQLCMDLGDPANAILTMVDGAGGISVPGDRIILVRTTTTTIQALSSVCTHAGCIVTFDRTSKGYNCPCHGSRYSSTGLVTRGPATSPLRRYQTQLDTATNQLTITL